MKRKRRTGSGAPLALNNYVGTRSIPAYRRPENSLAPPVPPYTVRPPWGYAPNPYTGQGMNGEAAPPDPGTTLAPPAGAQIPGHVAPGRQPGYPLFGPGEQANALIIDAAKPSDCPERLNDMPLIPGRDANNQPTLTAEAAKMTEALSSKIAKAIMDLQGGKPDKDGNPQTGALRTDTQLATALSDQHPELRREAGLSAPTDFNAWLKLIKMVMDRHNLGLKTADAGSATPSDAAMSVPIFLSMCDTIYKCNPARQQQVADMLLSHGEIRKAR
jgi:hypothetical protein